MRAGFLDYLEDQVLAGQLWEQFQTPREVDGMTDSPFTFVDGPPTDTGRVVVLFDTFPLTKPLFASVMEIATDSHIRTTGELKFDAFGDSPFWLSPAGMTRHARIPEEWLHASESEEEMRQHVMKFNATQ